MELCRQLCTELPLLFRFPVKVLEALIGGRNLVQLAAASFQIVLQLVRRTAVFPFETRDVFQALLQAIVFLRRKLQRFLKIAQQFRRIREQKTGLVQFFPCLRQVRCHGGGMPAVPGGFLRRVQGAAVSVKSRARTLQRLGQLFGIAQQVSACTEFLRLAR